MMIVKVEDVYNADKNLKKDHVLSLMDWIDKQGHLPKFSELEVIRFLSSCYYNNELAKRTIENNATMRTYMPEIYQNRCYEDIEKSYNVALICMLPTVTPEGYHISFVRLLDPEPTHLILKDSFKKLDMLASIYRQTVITSPGEIVIVDCTGAVMSHLLRIDVVLTKKFIFFIQNALPLRLKAIHFINANAVMEKAINIVKPFIIKELFSIIKLHTKLETFYECVPKESLPEEYGGKAGSIKELFEIERQRLMDYAEYLRSEEKLVVDETKRVGKSKNVNDVFGIEGTFKKLDID